MIEVLLFIGAVVFIVSLVQHNSQELEKGNSAEKTENSVNKNINGIEPEIIDVKDSNKQANQENNNIYNINITNVYVQQNNDSKNFKAEHEKDHTRAVWKRLGYKVKHGESYAYKHYGKEIFTPNQVRGMGDYHVKYSSQGLANKLVKQTRSKRMAKEILVDEYNLTQSEAKKLLGYREY